MTESKTDHFESGIATLSADATPEFDSSAPFKINGVALPVNTVVNGGQNVSHFFPEDVLRKARDKLEGVPIVKNFHDIEGQANADQVIGEVTDAGFQQGVGLVFEGEITDQDIAEKIAHGFLDVSPSPARRLGEFDESMGAQEVAELSGFRDLAVVANGQPGAKVDMGSNPAIEALSRDALSSEWDALQSDMTIHTPEFSDTADREWSKPTLNDFTEESWDDLTSDEKSAIGDHFIGSTSGFPAENFGDMFLPVVDEDGTLVLNALQNAKARAGQVEGLSGDDLDRVISIINELANDNFEGAEFGEQDTQSDDGTHGGESQSSAASEENDTMSDNELSDTEKAVLRAAEDIEEPIETLNSIAAAEQPKVVEQETLSEKDDKIEELADVFRDVLAEERGLGEETVSHMPVDALTAEFRNEDGEIETETLRQTPEAGTAGGEKEPTGGIDTLAADEKQDVKDKLRRAKLLENRTPDHADSLRAEAAEIAGVESADELEIDSL